MLLLLMCALSAALWSFVNSAVIQHKQGRLSLGHALESYQRVKSLYRSRRIAAAALSMTEAAVVKAVLRNAVDKVVTVLNKALIVPAIYPQSRQCHQDLRSALGIRRTKALIAAV